MTNAYYFLDIESGREVVDDVFIGAFLVGIHIDHDYDRTSIRHVFNQVFWDVLAGASYPQNIDTWVLNNGYAMIINRADSVSIEDFALFSRYCGIFLADSPDTSQGARGGYGSAVNVDFDYVQYGIIAQSTNSPGFKVSNIDFGPAWLGGQSLGKAAVYFETIGSMAPRVSVVNGSWRGTWAAGSPPFDGNGVGILNVADVPWGN